MEFTPQSIEIKAFTPFAKKVVEEAGRVCWKSEGRTQDKFIKMLIKKGHESVLEHASMTVKAVVDIAITREMVRHRHFSYSNESTRYVKYGELLIILPYEFIDMPASTQSIFMRAFTEAEDAYARLIDAGVPTELARKVLPCGAASEIVMTGNIRAWRDMLKQRALGSTGKPHVELQSLYLNLLVELVEGTDLSVFFQDLYDEAKKKALI